ncbi:MAG: hypothetical protein D6729_10920, partial [Deltaproteobacteria bacterium]
MRDTFSDASLRLMPSSPLFGILDPCHPLPLTSMSFGRSIQASLSPQKLEVLHRVAAAVHEARTPFALVAVADQAARPASGHDVLALGLLDRRHGLLEVYRAGEGTAARVPVESSGLAGAIAAREARLYSAPGSPLAP